MPYIVYFLGTGDNHKKDNNLINLLFKHTAESCVLFSGPGTGYEGVVVGQKTDGMNHGPHTERFPVNVRRNKWTGRGLTPALIGTTVNDNVQAAADVLGRLTPLDWDDDRKIVIVGHSRGAITAIRLGHVINRTAALQTKFAEVRLLLFDPVPGSGGGKFGSVFGQWQDTTLSNNVTECVEFFSQFEERGMFQPTLHNGDVVKKYFMPGNHTDITEVKNKGNTVHFELEGIVRNLSEKCLSRWGVGLSERCDLDSTRMILLYESILRRSLKFYARKPKGKTEHVRNARAIDSSGARSLTQLPTFAGTGWLNEHHEELFQGEFPMYYFYIKSGSERVYGSAALDTERRKLEGWLPSTLHRVNQVHEVELPPALHLMPPPQEPPPSPSLPSSVEVFPELHVGGPPRSSSLRDTLGEEDPFAD